MGSAHGTEPLSCARDSAPPRPRHPAFGVKRPGPCTDAVSAAPTPADATVRRRSPSLIQLDVGRSSRFRSPPGSASRGSGRPHRRSRGRHHATATIAKRACAWGQTSRGPDRLWLLDGRRAPLASCPGTSTRSGTVRCSGSRARAQADDAKAEIRLASSSGASKGIRYPVSAKF